MTKHTTHEPPEPIDWPHGHICVVLTGDDAEECIKITIHDTEHFLHATTARELHNMLGQRLDDFNKTNPFVPV